MKKIGLIACSNGLTSDKKDLLKTLDDTLRLLKIEPIYSDCLYQSKSTMAAADAMTRAEALMKFYRDDSLDAVCDISGGDMANEVLPYLDYELMRQHPKPFWGYSDLTTLINAIYAQTGQKSVLYQIKNLAEDTTGTQIARFKKMLLGEKSALFNWDYHFIQGTHLEGIVVGGNLRCFLKLAGTPYMPDLRDKILFLEAWSGTEAKIATAFAQLAQIGAFHQVKGMILGTFTESEKTNGKGCAAKLLLPLIDRDLPVIQTHEIGHDVTAKALRIGEFYQF